MVESQVTIADYRFDAETGELISLAEQPDNTHRLPPQPCQLLDMLIRAHPGIVSRTQIQQALWPGVTANYESNLHFCVRQLRSAFGDSASAPKYIETLPRRGYRLIPEPRRAAVSAIVGSDDGSSIDQRQQSTAEHDVTHDHTSNAGALRADEVATSTGLGECDGSPSPPFPSSETLRAGSQKTKVFAVFACVVCLPAICLALLSVFLDPNWNQPSPSDAEETNARIIRPRIAIMPFQTDLPDFGELGDGRIATICLEMFALHIKSLDILGPATTSAYTASDRSMVEMADSLEIDLIINGRYLAGEDGNRMLLEIIRVSDGRHIWVRSFASSQPADEISTLAVEQTLEAAEQLSSFPRVERG